MSLTILISKILTPLSVEAINKRLPQIKPEEKERILNKSYSSKHLEVFYWLYVACLITSGILGLYIAIWSSIWIYQMLFYGYYYPNWQMGEVLFALLNAAFWFMFPMYLISKLSVRFFPRDFIDYGRKKGLISGWTADENAAYKNIFKIIKIIFILIVVYFILSFIYFKLMK